MTQGAVTNDNQLQNQTILICHRPLFAIMIDRNIEPFDYGTTVFTAKRIRCCKITNRNHCIKQLTKNPTRAGWFKLLHLYYKNKFNKKKITGTKMIGQVYHFLRLWPNQWKNQKQLQGIQERKLRKLVTHAYETVPFYKKLYDEHGIKPTDIRTLKDIEKLPIITKEMVRNAGKTILSNKYKEKKLIKEDTGGSTGVSTAIYRTEKSLNISRASKLRAYFINGYKLTDKIAKINFYEQKKKFIHKLGLHRYYNVQTSQPIPLLAELLQKSNAEVYEGFPSAIEEIGLYKKKHNIPIKKPKNIFVNSEALSDTARSNIKRAFKTDPIDCYATTEAKLVAWECQKHKGLHINQDLVIVEIVDERQKPCPKGEQGEVVLTDLTNDASPFIRFNIQDISSYQKKKCPCKLAFATLERVYGKKMEFVILPSGEKQLGTSFFSKILSKYEEIEKYKVIQEKEGDINIYLKLIGEEKPNEKQIVKEIKNECENLPVKIAYVNEVKKTRAGKYLPFESRIER